MAIIGLKFITFNTDWTHHWSWNIFFSHSRSWISEKFENEKLKIGVDLLKDMIVFSFSTTFAVFSTPYHLFSYPLNFSLHFPHFSLPTLFCQNLPQLDGTLLACMNNLCNWPIPAHQPNPPACLPTCRPHPARHSTTTWPHPASHSPT